MYIVMIPESPDGIRISEPMIDPFGLYTGVPAECPNLDIRDVNGH